ncbi:MAG: hypothetical protein LBU32_25680 [Clostridiales bacterium]|nr:hypothetical protein [Clostridiales bacterium]
MPEKEDLYAIYQIKRGDKYHDIRFESIDRLEAAALTPDPASYEQVYTGPLPDVDKGRLLEHLYEQFNLHHPADFVGHSLSVSDVVVLREDGRESVHFVDSVGFATLADFVQGLDVPAYLPEHDPAIQPVVTILSSEESRLHNGARMPLQEADPLFKRLDTQYLDQPWYNVVQRGTTRCSGWRYITVSSARCRCLPRCAPLMRWLSIPARGWPSITRRREGLVGESGGTKNRSSFRYSYSSDGSDGISPSDMLRMTGLEPA